MSVTGIIVDLKPIMDELARCHVWFGLYRIVPLRRIISIVLSVHESEYRECIERDVAGTTISVADIEIFYITVSEMACTHVYRSGGHQDGLIFDSWVDQTVAVLRTD